MNEEKSILSKFDQVWSILDRSDPKKIQNKTVIFILVVNVTTFMLTFFDWWEIQFSSLIHYEQIWSNLIQNKTAIFILMVNVTTFYSNIFWYVQPLESFQFDQVWSSLIHFGQIWSKKIKNKTAIFILFKNVTTFYTNIFWYLEPLESFQFDQVWSILDRSDPKKSKTKCPFSSFL